MDESHVNKVILAVDDKPTNLKLLEAVLVSNGYRIETASGGRDALESIESVNPDLVLLDVMMPGMNGFEVCKEIRSRPLIPYIPIIFLTAVQLDQADVIRGLDIGGDDYIRKPFDELELLSRIRAALRVKQLNDELRRTKAELARYVSLSTLRMVEMISSGKQVPSGRTTDVTVLFSDIRGFTHLAASLTSSKVFEVLNLYLSKQIQIVEQHGGIVDKLTGDEVMAVFDGPDMVSNALRCGRGIVETLCESEPDLNTDWIGVGIGINTGPVYVGSVGSETMKDYTVVGNTVNVAARLCGVAKNFQILFAENTERLIGPRQAAYSSIGRIGLKGLRKRTEVFELKSIG